MLGNATISGLVIAPGGLLTVDGCVVINGGKLVLDFAKVYSSRCSVTDSDVPAASLR